jgi:hypothetical protein
MRGTRQEVALSLLITLEAAQQGRRVLFSDEQKILFEGWKKGFVKNTKLDFHETLTKPRMRVI